MQKFSEFNGTFPPLGDIEPLPTINHCCNTKPEITSEIEVFVNTVRNGIAIVCPVCNRQSFKIWIPKSNQSKQPSSIQIRYWNSQNA